MRQQWTGVLRPVLGVTMMGLSVGEGVGRMTIERSGGEVLRAGEPSGAAVVSHAWLRALALEKSELYCPKYHNARLTPVVLVDQTDSALKVCSSAWALAAPGNWFARVSPVEQAAELEALRTSMQRRRAFGNEAWVLSRATKRFSLESTLRLRRRPKQM